MVCSDINKLKNGATIHSSANGSYNYHGFKIKNSRGSGVVCFMGNGYDNGAGVINFSYQTSRDSVYVDKKMTQPSYVKFYHDANAFYIIFYVSTKWDTISLSGTFINESDSVVEEYFSNEYMPSGATQVTETAYPTT